MYRLFLLALLLSAITLNVYAAEIQIPLSSGTDIPVSIYSSATKKADSLLLWLPSEYGLHGKEQLTAQTLAEKGTEVWIADLHSAYFSAPGRRSYNTIELRDIVDLIIASSAQGKREVTLFATGRAAAFALLAARELQTNTSTKDIVKSAILFHPNFYTNTSEVGKDLEYLPITYASNLAIYIAQPALSGKSYQLESLQQHLRKGGSDVITQVLPDVADGFNVRKADNLSEENLYQKTPSIIRSAIKLLKLYKKPRSARFLPPQQAAVSTSTMNAGLQQYQGTISNPYLNFSDLSATRHTFENHRGDVLLLNFWASWCPPCVKELPSLNRLQSEIKHPNFKILAINIGEEENKVQAFLRPMTIDFPVLTDPEGLSVLPWKLVAFPSSFVIDKKGNIRYGLFGAIEWDNPEVIGIIQHLLSED
ncbi:MAG: TlpA family protein disulfide reductase [Gammaproteobacteria bacterium]|nr:TlpA family protein disulfide reductase [Gammaproteobacteria bacterium]